MRADRKRVAGFYWVRFEGYQIVAEYTDGKGCTDSSTENGFSDKPHWHVPASDVCFSDRQVCELLYGPIPTPDELKEARAALARTS